MKKISGETLDTWFDNVFNCYKIFGENIEAIIKQFDQNVDINEIHKTSDYKIYKDKIYKVIKYGSCSNMYGDDKSNLMNYLNGIYGTAKTYDHDYAGPEAITQGSYNILDVFAIPLVCLIGLLYDNQLTLLTTIVHEFGHDFGAFGRGPLKFSDPSITAKFETDFNLCKKTSVTQQSSDPDCSVYSLEEIDINQGIFKEFIADYLAVCFIEKYFEINNSLTITDKVKLLKNSFSWACEPKKNKRESGHPQHSIRVNTILLNENLFNFYMTNQQRFM
jgi:hypothetical protein